MCLLGGTRLSTLANGVIGFGLFGMAVIGAFMKPIGGFMQQLGNAGGEPVMQIGRFVSILMPSEVVWRRALAEMSEGINPIRALMLPASPPDQGVVLYVLFCAVVLSSLALLSFI